MPKNPKRSWLTGARRRGPKRRNTAGSRWMQLSTGEIQVLETLQTCQLGHIMACMVSMLGLMRLLLLKTLLVNNRLTSSNPNALAIVDKAILLFSANLVTYTKFSQQWFRLDHALHDITPQEESFPLYRKKSNGIGLDSWDDLECYENTRFTSDQLCRIYNCFGLDEYLLLQQETQIRVPTRGQNQWGQAC